MYLNQCYYIRY